MKITMIEVEATQEDLRASRTAADALSMALSRIADRLCGYGDTAAGEPEDENVDSDN